jgi:hypothetical protein
VGLVSEKLGLLSSSVNICLLPLTPQQVADINRSNARASFPKSAAKRQTRREAGTQSHGPLEGGSRVVEQMGKEVGVSDRSNLSEERGGSGMDEQATIKDALVKRREECEVWSKAYHRAAQSTLAWNSRLVVIAIAAAAITTGISGFASQAELAFLSYIVVVLGIVIAIVNAFQKVTFASPESAKEYHNAAIEYGRVARMIDGVLTLGSVVTMDKLLEERTNIETKYDSVESQATELPRKLSESAYGELASRTKVPG